MSMLPDESLAASVGERAASKGGVGKMPKQGEECGASEAVDQGQDYWELVPHKAHARAAGLLLSGVMLALTAGACIAGVFLVKSRTDSYLAPATFIAAALFFVSAAAVPVMMFREATIDEDEDKKCKRDCDVLEAALNQIGKDGNPTLSGLAKANFRQMRMFTVIALRQARSSYYASLVAASASLLVLAFGGAVAVGVVPTSGKIAAGSVTAVGVALSGFLSVTFMNTYRMAARQMSYYYGQPLVHCYLLHAEWLTWLLTKDADSKDDADLWARVIAAAIQASENAQAHLLSMQDHALDSRSPQPSQANGANTKARRSAEPSPKAG